MAERKPNGYWRDFGNVVRELYAMLDRHCLDYMPGLDDMRLIEGCAMLSYAIRYYHPELRDMVSGMSATKKERLQRTFEKNAESCDTGEFFAHEGGNPEKRAGAKENLETALSVLDKKQRKVVDMKFEGYTFKDIGKVFKLTKSRIEQIYSASLEKIRNNSRCRRLYDEIFIKG